MYFYFWTKKSGHQYKLRTRTGKWTDWYHLELRSVQSLLLLHFVASLFSTGVDNEKAIELTNSTVFHNGRQWKSSRAWQTAPFSSFEYFSVLSWTISNIFSRLTVSWKSVKLFSDIPLNVLNWFHLQTTRKPCRQLEMLGWIQATTPQNTIFDSRKLLKIIRWASDQITVVPQSFVVKPQNLS